MTFLLYSHFLVYWVVEMVSVFQPEKSVRDHRFTLTNISNNTQSLTLSPLLKATVKYLPGSKIFAL